MGTGPIVLSGTKHIQRNTRSQKPNGHSDYFHFPFVTLDNFGLSLFWDQVQHVKSRYTYTNPGHADKSRISCPAVLHEIKGRRIHATKAFSWLDGKSRVCVVLLERSTNMRYIILCRVKWRNYATAGKPV